MTKTKKIIIVAGEESGDMYAANIIKNFSKRKEIIFYGMGSSKVKETNIEILVDSSELSVLGLIEIIKMYPRLLYALRTMKKSISSIRPDLLILIDYQEFNMKLARYAKSIGIKVLFYISPQVWAWRENRIKNIKNYIDEMAVIFPFEEKYYKNLGVKATYVGHPLLNNNDYKKVLNQKKEYIGFFPGSRLNEIKKHLPLINQIIEHLHNKFPKENFLISSSNNINKKIFDSDFYKKKYVNVVSSKNIYETIDMCKIAVAASGTITLQIALKKIPMCVFYRLSNITYLIAKILVKTKFISLVNIVLNKEAIKEFVQKDASCKSISDELIKIKEDNHYRNKIISDYEILEKKLSDDSSKENIIDVIERLIKEVILALKTVLRLYHFFQ